MTQAGGLSRTALWGLAAVVFASGMLLLRPRAGAPGALAASRGLEAASAQDENRAQVDPDVFDRGVAWINSAGKIRLGDLKGKIVLLDFWTFCCINCHHVLPDLDYLERKYANELVVIGVHSAKFDAEKDTENIRRKVAEYRIKHPVVNDAEMGIWRYFGVNSWPTLVLIDANGRYVGHASGEGNREILDEAIGRLAREHRAKNELNETPFVVVPESERAHTAPLLYPGKVLADVAGGRLFISDTGHNRIVVTDLSGKALDAIGSGKAGFDDGGFESASFDRQQGMALIRETLYVADVENHAIRAADLSTRKVRTVAGTGKQTYHPRGGPVGGKATETGLNSPWDLVQVPGKNQLIVAMAGPHQIWRLDLDKGVAELWSGTGREDIIDGPATRAAYAQPSGLATDGTSVFVADSEVSGIRAVSLADASAKTLVGKGLFDFGDVDGDFDKARLQHCLGVAYGDGILYVADSYNNKIKALDLAKRVSRTFSGDGAAGDSDDPARYHQPGGVSFAGDALYVADTNNHRIARIDLATGKVRTLELAGVERPKPARSKPSFPLAKTISVPPAKVKPGDALKFAVKLELPAGFKLGPDTSVVYLVEAPGGDGILSPRMDPNGGAVDPAATDFEIEAMLAKPLGAGEGLTLKVSVSAFICEAEKGFCQPKSYVFEVPIEGAADGGDRVELTGRD